MRASKSGAAVLSVLSNSLLILLKVAVGLLTGSVAVLSEAIHSAVDLVAALIALFAVRKSGQAADERHPYGHGKFENISGTIEALLIFLAAAWIIYEAVRKLISPRAVDMPVWGVGVMLVSAIVNIVVSGRLLKVGRETESVALQADAWHLRTDVYTSAGVMVGLLAIWLGSVFAPDVDLRWVDPAVAIVVALL
ncbi:MAG: cation transporter, partial [Thermoleophilia bacterium]|nr:cation transporter [Thermoleophilia bacterium]